MDAARRWITLALLTALATATACSGGEATQHPTPEDCRNMLDHIMELRTGGMETERAAAHREALESAIGDRVLDSCATRPPAYVDCVRNADDSADIRACADTAEEGRGS